MLYFWLSFLSEADIIGRKASLLDVLLGDSQSWHFGIGRCYMTEWCEKSFLVYRGLTGFSSHRLILFRGMFEFNSSH